MAWVGFPMIMRPHWGAGSRKAYLIHTPEELLARWDQSGRGQFILQEWLTGAHYVHCLVVGTDALPITRPMRQAPGPADDDDTGSLADDVAAAALAVSNALGYRINAVEFAVRGGQILATDWLNHAPPIDAAGLSEAEMTWVVDRTARLLRDLAAAPPAPTYRWAPLVGQTA
jgi:hypothetical protein